MAKILTVDDEAFILTILEAVLESDGHEVVSIDDSEKAVEFIKSDEAVDLMITDVRMDPIDGVQLLNLAKKCHGSESQSKSIQVLHYGFVTLPRDIAGPLVLGLIIAGAITIAIPTDFFAEALGTGFLAMLVMMLLGMPVYVCATASIPVAAAMMLKGVTPGAALVFLMTGPATNAATIATLWKVLGSKTTLLYMAIVAGTALTSGLVLDLLFDVTGISPGHVGHWMLPDWARTLSALALIAVLAPAMLPRKKDHDHKAEA